MDLAASGAAVLPAKFCLAATLALRRKAAPQSALPAEMVAMV